jgi:hypothetical protein
MSKALRGALIGGAVGALVAVAQTARRENDPPSVITVQAVKGAAEGALVGGLVGWALDHVSVQDVRDAWAGTVELARNRAEDLTEAVRARAA